MTMRSLVAAFMVGPIYLRDCRGAAFPLSEAIFLFFMVVVAFFMWVQTHYSCAFFNIFSSSCESGQSNFAK